MPIVIEDHIDGTPAVERDIRYDELPLHIVMMLAMGGDKDAVAWLNDQAPLRASEWNEDDHPRDDNGRFGGGTGPDGQDKPIKCGDDLDKAARLLGEGRKIELNQPDQVSTLLDKLAAIGNEAKAKGEKAPNYNLCNVSVPGTNLFCNDTIGVPRVEMPQLAGVPVAGTPADKLEHDSKGEVNASAQFISALNDTGVRTTQEDLPASHLRASQAELKGSQVGGMMKAIENGTLPPGTVFVTRDNYILDGHHRWAAEVGVDMRGGRLPGMEEMKIHVTKIDMDIGAALDFAKQWSADFGIATKAALRLLDDPAAWLMIDPRRRFGDDVQWELAEWNEEDHPRDDNGRFGGGSGGGGEKTQEPGVRLSPIHGTPKAGESNRDLTMKQFPEGIQKKVEASFEKLHVTHEQMHQNFRSIFDHSVDTGIMMRFKDWYSEAHAQRDRIAEATGVNPHIASAVIAATSAGRNWDDTRGVGNVTTAECVISSFTHYDERISSQLIEETNARLDGMPRGGGTEFRLKEGMTYGEALSYRNPETGELEPRLAAVMIARDTEMIGRVQGVEDPSTATTVMGIGRGYDGIEKAVRLCNIDANAMTDAQVVQSISGTLNGAPKERSFFNNIEDPLDKGGNRDVTIDSHIFDASVNGYPSTPEGETRVGELHDDRKKEDGGTNLMTTVTGNPGYEKAPVGVYPLIGDDLRKLTDEVNIAYAGQPGFPLVDNQVQAAIWGEQISQYPQTGEGSVTNVTKEYKASHPAGWNT